jgi:heat shock protein HslJ
VGTGRQIDIAWCTAVPLSEGPDLKWTGENQILRWRLTTAVILVLLCAGSQAEARAQKITVTGSLGRTMAIGGESTGWAIQLEPGINLDGHRVDAIEVAYPDSRKLEQLENKRVRATGVLSHRQGVETGARAVLVVSLIREVKATAQPVAAKTLLIGSEWLLEDLGGSGVLDNIQTTLAFPEAGKVAGGGSCNRFFGPTQISGHTMKIGPLAATRMSCPEALMAQEMKYLNALQAAERFHWKDPELLIYCQGLEKPLRFTRLPAPGPALEAR